MTGASSVAAREDAAEADLQTSTDQTRRFLAALSTVLRETVTAFESTVGRITEITVTRPGRADRDLVVALQDFDRLQQEFATLGEVLARLSKPDLTEADAAGHELIATISIADLKDRLAHHFRALAVDASAPELSQDVEF